MKAIALATLFVLAGVAAQAETAIPDAAPKGVPSDAATVTPAAGQPAAAPAAPRKKVAVVRQAKYNGGEGSVVRTGRNAYSFGGSYGGCQYRGYVNATGYHLDRGC